MAGKTCGTSVAPSGCRTRRSVASSGRSAESTVGTCQDRGVVGLDVRVRAYPGGRLRDAGQIAPSDGFAALAPTLPCEPRCRSPIEDRSPRMGRGASPDSSLLVPLQPKARQDCTTRRPSPPDRTQGIFGRGLGYRCCLVIATRPGTELPCELRARSRRDPASPRRCLDPLRSVAALQSDMSGCRVSASRAATEESEPVPCPAPSRATLDTHAGEHRARPPRRSARSVGR